MKSPIRVVPGLLVPGLIAVSLMTAACSDKSSSPTSPSGTGSTAGVTITAPKPLSPADGAELQSGQGVTLRLQNASSNSERTFWHEVEVATDSGFANKVATADKVAPGSDGQAAATLTTELSGGKAYYWRARAVDGANTGPYSTTSSFKVVAPVAIDAPAASSPANGATIDSTTPTLTVVNGNVTGTTATVTYRFEVATDAGFGSIAAVWTAPRGSGTTTVTGTALTAGTEYFWRVIGTDGTTTGAYSVAQSFKTPAATGGGGGANTGNWPTDGPGVIAWAQRTYPDRLAPTSSGGRVENMAFLRDRMIEAGLCGGVQLAWNLKRGGPEISVDYFVWNNGGRWVGVDIANDYDNAGNSLKLTWAPMPDDPYATYGGYTNPLPCR
jgi:hypothetical protein